MSDTHGAEGAETESFDFTDVPMDGADAGQGAAERTDGGEGEGEGEERQQQQQQERQPLSAEELESRYQNTRTALAEERRERRALQRQIDELRRGGPAPEQRQHQQRQEPEAEIDPEEDPIGALRQMRAKIRAYEQAEEQATRSSAEQQRVERGIQATFVELGEYERDFREENADYDKAAAHYAQARAHELMNFGIQPAKVQTMLREEFANLARSAVGAGKNPAAVIYQLAKGRGFGTGKPGPGQGEQPGKVSKLDELAKGARAASPLSRSGGRPSNGLDATTVANINIRDPKGAEAFDKAWDAMEREAKRTARGG